MKITPEQMKKLLDAQNSIEQILNEVITEPPEKGEVSKLKAQILTIITDIETDEKKGIFEKEYYINRLLELTK